MVDISTTVAPKSDQINADDLISGPKTFTIEHVNANPDTPDQPVNVFFKETKLPFRPCKSMRRVMIAVWGPDASKYKGLSLTLYRDPKVKFGGMEVGGVRISHMSGMDKPMTMALTASRAKRAPYTVKPLEDTTPTIDPDAALQSAKDAAMKGKDEFTKWWKENADKRDIVKPIMEELKAMVEEADKPEIDDDEVPL